MNSSAESRAKLLVWIPALLTSLLALGAYSSLNRPLLYDEFVYFMAGPLTFTEVLSAIHETTTNLNQGVTGAYLLFDWSLMQVFGAAPWALRLPSMIFGILFLLYSFIFLRQRGFGWGALTVFPVFLVTQELVLHYVGEARTYMPLAAAVVGLLAYYTAPSEFKNGGRGLLLGWSAALIGVLFHPYMAIYWPVVLVFGYLLTHRQRGWRSFVRWSNPWMVVVSASLYLAVAAVTWARGRATAYVDPFNFLPRSVPVEIIAQNLYAFVRPSITIFVLIAVVVSVLSALTTRGLKQRIRSLVTSLVPTAALYLAAFLLAAVVSVSSIVADFWIFPRQWIASTALMAIAMFWAGCLVQQAANQVSRVRGLASGALLSVAIVVPAAVVLMTQSTELAEWNSRSSQPMGQQQVLRSELAGKGSLSDGEWMAFAQANADTGGLVWPEFRSYYLDTDWSQFVLRDGTVE